MIDPNEYLIAVERRTELNIDPKPTLGFPVVKQWDDFRLT